MAEVIATVVVLEVAVVLLVWRSLSNSRKVALAAAKPRAARVTILNIVMMLVELLIYLFEINYNLVPL